MKLTTHTEATERACCSAKIMCCGKLCMVWRWSKLAVTDVIRWLPPESCPVIPPSAEMFQPPRGNGWFAEGDVFESSDEEFPVLYGLRWKREQDEERTGYIIDAINDLEKAVWERE